MQNLLQDDFWLTYFNVLLPLLGMLFSLPMLLLPGRYPKEFVACVGRDVDEEFAHLSCSPRNQ